MAGKGGSSRAPRVRRDSSIFEDVKRYGGRGLEVAGDVAGKVWASPNTAIGLTAGGLGHVAGLAKGTRPRISVGNNAIQFENNPVAGRSAVTLGNVSIYSPYDSVDRSSSHEKPHTYQAQQLGPFYLPSNLLGGAAGLLLDRHEKHPWHGPHNWNEVGPQMNPPRPWPWSPVR